MQTHRTDFVLIIAVRGGLDPEIFEKQIAPEHIRMWTMRLKRNFETVFVCN